MSCSYTPHTWVEPDGAPELRRSMGEYLIRIGLMEPSGRVTMVSTCEEEEYVISYFRTCSIDELIRYHRVPIHDLRGFNMSESFGI